jgi:hypothetical protein
MAVACGNPYQRLHLPLASFCAIRQHTYRLSCRNNLIQPGKINDGGFETTAAAVGIDIT